MSYALIYVTVGSEEEARAIARDVVERRLAACANILGAIASVYWWEERVREDREVALILKTRRELVDRLTERVRALHSYDCPCVVALAIERGNPAFLEWIGTETAAARD